MKKNVKYVFSNTGLRWLNKIYWLLLSISDMPILKISRMFESLKNIRSLENQWTLVASLVELTSHLAQADAITFDRLSLIRLSTDCPVDKPDRRT